MVEQKEPESASSCLETTPKKHHVLMVAFAAQGHINPLLRLGMLLQSKGLQVTLASNQFTHQRLLKRLATITSETTATTAVPSSISISGIRFEFFSDGTNLADYKDQDADEYWATMAKNGPINLSKLITDLHERGEVLKFSCVINNPFVPWVADVAEEHGIPCAMLWIQPCALFSIYYRFYNDLNQFPSSSDQIQDPEIQLPGLPLLRIVDLPSFVLPSNPFGTLSKILSQSLRNTHKIKWVLANSFSELESQVIESIFPHVPIKTVGPLVPPSLLQVKHHDDDNRRSKSIDNGGFDMWDADEDCLDWLDKMPPRSVIYISFGSFTVLPTESMESIAVALQNTKIPFLWVAKPPDIEASEGANQVPEWFGKVTKEEQGRVVSWCTQGRVLSHPSVACFLTHCGWNSVLESMSAGVPLICYPLWTDQPTNAKFVVHVFEKGVRVWPDEERVANSKEIEKCIEEIMVGPSAARIRKKAGEWKRAASEAAASGGSSDRNVQWLVDQIVRSVSS